MSKKRTDFLSGFVVEQYPIDILKEIINSVVDIVDNFIIELGEDEYLSLSSTSRYDERVGSSQRNTTSKIETMCIKKSAIVRFSIKMGLEKFVPLFKNETNLKDN